MAIHNSDELIGDLKSDEPYSHAEKLAPMIKEVLSLTKVSKKELSAIAVSSGPGSYTGLRIGTSTAKGLCFALDIPLIDIGTLASMLESIPKIADEQLLCPMLDARRMEVYCLLALNNGEVIENTQARIIDALAFSEFLYEREITFFGNGAEKCKKVITSKNAIFIDGIKPSAINIGKLALSRFKEGNFADVAYFEPEYLKPYMTIQAKNPFI